MNSFIRKNLAKIFIIIALSMFLTSNLQAQTNDENSLKELYKQLPTNNYTAKLSAIGKLPEETKNLVALIAQDQSKDKQIRKMAIEILKEVALKRI
ncbi:MAG: hypothetical protein IPK14_07785 [Blastocatellia bacterium]|nr:hypothetical protein [Blastocatellia bacterium]